MNYPKKNKLDPFKARLLEWSAEGKTQLEMLALLKSDGCSCSASSLSDYLKLRRRESMESAVLGNVASGREMLRKLDAAYQDNPEPAIAELIRVSKSLILSLQIEGAVDLDKLRMATVMQQMVLNYLSGETKARLEARKIELGESKYRDQVTERKRAIEAELGKARTGGGLTPETLDRIERELKLL